jgi:hypothetical protein
MKMAELVAEGRVTDLPAGEVQMGRFAHGGAGSDLITLPFPTS